MVYVYPYAHAEGDFIDIPLGAGTAYETDGDYYTNYGLRSADGVLLVQIAWCLHTCLTAGRHVFIASVRRRGLGDGAQPECQATPL